MDSNGKHALPDKLARLPLLNKGPQGRVLRFFTETIWDARLEELGRGRRFGYKCARVAFLATVGFVGDNCMLRAMALTYTTVLSLVPLLAFSFAILKGLGFYEDLRRERIEPYLDTLFGAAEQAPAPLLETSDAPLVLASGAPEEGLAHLRGVFNNVLDMVDGTDVKGLGAIGLVVLLLAVHRLLSSVEASFNQIWSVRKARTLVRKLSDYLTMVVITPIFLVVAIGVTTALQNTGVIDFLEEKLALGVVLQLLIKLAPVLVGWMAFTLLYLVMPNRRGRFGAALLGGFFASLAWEGALLAHIAFQIGVAKYNAIYAGFAAIPIFLVWVQLSWGIVLAGAELAYASEKHYEYQGVGTGTRIAPAHAEHVAVRLMARLSEAFLAGERGPSVPELARRVGVALSTVDRLLSDLRERELVAAIESSEAGQAQGWQPARDPATIRISDVLLAVRGEVRASEGGRFVSLDALADRALRALDAEGRSSVHNRTMRELVERAAREETAPDAAPAASPAT
ncbi:MAG: YihY family inner membrane protein [Planctomycetes bacterium]|nr:YihY family inner membrane protein [Planctomycetota bacterium]